MLFDQENYLTDSQLKNSINQENIFQNIELSV